jgi:iron(III) transport system permease protein
MSVQDFVDTGGSAALRASRGRPPFLHGDRIVLGALGVLVAILALLPLARLAWETLMSGGTFSVGPLAEVLSSQTTWTALRNTVLTGLGGTVIAVLLGGAVALVASFCDIRMRGLFVFSFVMPMMLAPQVAALAWLQVTGPSSPFLKLLGLAPPLGTRNPLYSAEGVMLVLGMHYAPLVFITIRAGLRALPRDLVEAAATAGASPLTAIRTVVLPLMRPALVAATALSFVSCIGNFGIAAFLGIPGQFVVLPTLIYQRIAGLGPGALAEVASLSMLIGAVAMAGIALQEFSMRRAGRYRLSGASRGVDGLYPLRRWRLPVELGLWSIVLLTLVLPLIGLVLTSLVPAYGVPLNLRTMTLDNYAHILLEHGAAKRALVNSLSLAGVAAVMLVAISIPLGYFAAWRQEAKGLRAVTIAAELAYALPGVVLAIACILLFLRPLPVIGLSIYNTVWIILFAYLSRFLILGLRPVIGGYQQLDRALEEAAQAAGAGFGRRLIDILAPLVAPAAAAGGFLVFLTAFNELTVSALLWSSGAETLGVVVFSFEQGGESTSAAAVAVLTVVLTLALMLSTLVFARRLPQGMIPWRD